MYLEDEKDRDPYRERQRPRDPYGDAERYGERGESPRRVPRYSDPMDVEAEPLEEPYRPRRERPDPSTNQQSPAEDDPWA